MSRRHRRTGTATRLAGLTNTADTTARRARQTLEGAHVRIGLRAIGPLDSRCGEEVADAAAACVVVEVLRGFAADNF